MKIPAFPKKERNICLLLLAAGLLAAGLLAAFVASPGQAVFHPADSALADVDRDVWRTGYTVEGDMHLAKSTMRHVSPIAIMRSDGTTKDIFFVVAAPAQYWIIESASMNLGKISGSYPFIAAISLEVYSMDGNYLRSLTSRAVNVQYTTPGTWKSLRLVGPQARQVSAGELLAFHFQLSGDPDGNLEAYPVFEISAVKSWARSLETSSNNVLIPFILLNNQSK